VAGTEPPPKPAAAKDEKGAASYSQHGGLHEEDPSYPSYGMERDGKREGIWRTYDENGVLQAEVNYVAGIREGPFTQWFENGQVLNRGTFVKDKETGSYESFHQSGAPLSTGQMLNGKQHGLWIHQASDGTLVSELNYFNGLLDGPCSYYINGARDATRSGIYSKGKKISQ
jgi:antitoxin component YwqK of YwqJK toxin-antitoxin module